MPRKNFLNGYPLPASDLNTYLMDQAVQTFADATARTAALPTPTEGMVSYLADTDTVYVYDGSSWNAIVDAKNYGSVLPNGAAGRNKIINGAFDFWQRGTSTTSATYLADRFVTGSTEIVTTSQQTFTPGTAPIAGYEAQYHARVAVTFNAGAGYFTQYAQTVEDVRTFAGQTVTFSYWAKADAAKSVAIELQQVFGTGGSASVNTFVVKQALTTSWVRYSHTFAVPSVAGKTIGTNSYASIRWWLSAGSSFDTRTGTLGQQNITFDVWGVQLEAGSVATPFARAAGTLQGELAACQRYYQRTALATGAGVYGYHGASYSTTAALIPLPAHNTMRTVPTSIEWTNVQLSDGVAGFPPSAMTIWGSSTVDAVYANVTGASGLTQYRPYYLATQNSAAASYVGFSAEL